MRLTEVRRYEKDVIKEAGMMLFSRTRSSSVAIKKSAREADDEHAGLEIQSDWGFGLFAETPQLKSLSIDRFFDCFA
jgi:hypothetical protein